MTVKRMMTAFLLPLLAGAAQAAPVQKKEKSVVVSTQSAPISIESVYTVSQKRDPFIKAAGGQAAGKPQGEHFVFSIHDLALSAVMKDSRMGYAMFSHKETGAAYVLRMGKLYDYRDKRVPDVMGTVDIKKKSVNLIGKDKDSERFRLGKDDEEEEEVK